MDKVIEIRKTIGALLAPVHPRVFYESADDKAAYPYLVFDLPNSVDDGSMEQFVLELDGWDAPANGSTIVLEELMSRADAVLHQVAIRSPELAIVIRRDNRLTIRDEDKRLRRRQYQYQIRTYGGG